MALQPATFTAFSAAEPPADASSARTADLALPVDGGLGEDFRGERLGICLRSAFDGLLCLCLRGERDREPGCPSCECCQPERFPSKLPLNDLRRRLPPRLRLDLDLDLLRERDGKLKLVGAARGVLSRAARSVRLSGGNDGGGRSLHST